MWIKLLRFVDKYIFWLLILIFFWIKYFFIWNKSKLITQPKKILVIRLWALGSSLLSFNMIKELRNHYWDDVQIDLLASTRNIWVFKNQWYFENIYNLLNYKDLLKFIFSFKKYDIVLDTEEYFRASSLISFWVWKINVGYNNLKVRWLAYNSPVWYDDRNHSLLACMDLLKPLSINYTIPQSMEKYVYQDKDTIKVNNFIKNYEWKTFVCMHAWGAETSPERFWDNQNWIELIWMVLDKHEDLIIFMSGTAFEKTAIQEIINNLDNKYKTRVVDMCWMFNLSEFAYFLTKVNVMISNDTWPMHLAASMWTNTIGLFGPNLPIRFWPYPLDKNIGLYKWDWTTYIDVHLGRFESCSTDIINSITPNEVLEAVERSI